MERIKKLMLAVVTLRVIYGQISGLRTTADIVEAVEKTGTDTMRKFWDDMATIEALLKENVITLRKLL